MLSSRNEFMFKRLLRKAEHVQHERISQLRTKESSTLQPLLSLRKSRPNGLTFLQNIVSCSQPLSNLEHRPKLAVEITLSRSNISRTFCREICEFTGHYLIRRIVNNSLVSHNYSKLPVRHYPNSVRLYLIYLFF